MSRSTTALVVTFNSSKVAGELAATLDSLADRCGAVVVDSDSRDGTVDLLGRLMPGIRVISTGVNRGFGSACNLGLSRVETPYTLLLNHDARIDAASLELLERWLDANPGTAAVQPLIRAWGWPEVTASRGMGITGMYEGYDLGFMRFEPGPGGGPVRGAGATAAVSLWRTDVLSSLSGFDPGFFMYFEDVDLCIRARLRGWSLDVLPEAEAQHMVGVASSRSSAGVWEIRSACRLAMKYGRDPGRARMALLGREIRSLAAMRTGLPAFLRRVAAIAAENAGRTGEVFEPSSKPPSELPAERSPRPFRLDPGGIIVSGPGWVSGRAMRGYGAFIAGSGCRLTVDMESRGGPVTGRLYCGSEPGAAYRTDSRGSRFSFILGPGRHCLAADDRNSVILISGMRVDEQTG